MAVIIIGEIATPIFYRAAIMPKANPRLFYVTKKQQEEKSILLKIVKEIPTKHIEYIG